MNSKIAAESSLYQLSNTSSPKVNNESRCRIESCMSYQIDSGTGCFGPIEHHFHGQYNDTRHHDLPPPKPSTTQSLFLPLPTSCQDPPPGQYPSCNNQAATPTASNVCWSAQARTSVLQYQPFYVAGSIHSFYFFFTIDDICNIWAFKNIPYDVYCTILSQYGLSKIHEATNISP